MKILKFLDDNLERYFLLTSLVFIVVLIFLQVVLRYFFNYSLSWAEELARYLLLYQIWVGTSYGVKKEAHIRVTILQQMVSERNKVRIEVFTTVLWLVFTVFLAAKSGQLVGILMNRGQLSAAMQIPMGYAYASVPVGCSLMAFRLCQKLYKEVKKLEQKEVVVK